MIAVDCSGKEVVIGDTVQYNGYPFPYTVTDIVESFDYVQLEIKPSHGGDSFLAAEEDVELV